MRCREGGFIFIRHNDSKDTEIEPKLIPISEAELQVRMSNNSNEARLDIMT